MTNTMEEFYNNRRINSLNISQNKCSHQFISRSDGAKPQGDLKEEIYDLYYDNDSTITTALDTTPAGGRILDPNLAAYNVEKVFEQIERNAPWIFVCNDSPIEGVGSDNLFVIASHIEDEFRFSRERIIYPQEFKVYKNIFELRLRSPTAGLPYRCTEYEVGTL